MNQQAEQVQKQLKDIIAKINDSGVEVPSAMLISIMAGVINTSTPKDKDVKQLAEFLKDKPLEEVISFSILTCCNSIVISMWNSFRQNFEKKEPIDISKFLKPKAEAPKA